MAEKIRRQEIKFQGHLIKSYATYGGKARKWASEWQKGPADLVCALPGWGGHLVEVKHRPTFSLSIKNPMDLKQQEEANQYLKGGMPVYLAIVRGGHALESQITYLNPLEEQYAANECTWFDYKAGCGFPIPEILRHYGENNV